MRLAPLLLALIAVPLLASPGSARSSATPSFTRIATGLDQPVYLTATSAEPGKLFVVEKSGFVRVLVNGSVQPQPFLDLSGEVTTDEEQGLLSIAFDRRFASNHFVYAAYSDLGGDLRVDRFTAAGGSVDPATGKHLLVVEHSEFANHYGGLLTAAPDGRLYLGTGDGGSGGDPHDHAQDQTSGSGSC